MSLKSPKCCFPLYSFYNGNSNQNGDLTEEELVKQRQTVSKDRSKVKGRIQGQYFVSMEKDKWQKRECFIAASKGLESWSAPLCTSVLVWKCSERKPQKWEGRQLERDHKVPLSAPLWSLSFTHIPDCLFVALLQEKTNWRDEHPV